MFRLFQNCNAGLPEADVEDFDGATGEWTWDAEANSGSFAATIVAVTPPAIASGTFLTWEHQCGSYNVSATFDEAQFGVTLYYYDDFDGWQPAAAVASGEDYLFEERPGDPDPVPLTCGLMLGLQVNGLSSSSAGAVTVTLERF